MMNLRHVARLLGGEVSGSRILCPGPGHSRRDRSLSVRFSDTARDGFVVASFAMDDFRACRDHVRHLLGLGDFRTSAREEKFSSLPKAVNDDADTSKKDLALAIWRETLPLAGSPGEAYLAGRCVPYSGPALRWHPSCPFGKGVRSGCMVALVRDISTDEPMAIHRTAIDRHGKKLSHLGSSGRLTLGSIRGGVVKLADDADVTTALGVGEGIETVLALPRLVGAPSLPVWSVLSAGPLAAFPVLNGVESLWIAVDHDQAGIRASRQLAGRWMDADRNVNHVAAEKPGQDLNDVLCEVK